MLLPTITTIKSRLYRSIPLIILYSTLLVVMTALSPLAWNVSGLNFKMIGIVASLGIICAYVTVVFIDENASRNTQ